MSKQRSDDRQVDSATAARAAGLAIVRSHPLLGTLATHATFRDVGLAGKNLCPPGAWAIVVDDGSIHLSSRRDEPQVWAYCISHCLLHLAFEHFHKHEKPAVWNAAACVAVSRMQQQFNVGWPVPDFTPPVALPKRSEESLYEEWCLEGVPEEFRSLSVGGPISDLWFSRVFDEKDARHVQPWGDYFGEAIRTPIRSALSGLAPKNTASGKAEEARLWFINHYPLLGALAAAFELVDDQNILSSMRIGLGAVDVAAQRIYINTLRLNSQELLFVMAHEMLHAALRHDARRQGRDPFTWNVACDYAINGWLVEMRIGQPPKSGMAFDPALQGMSAEEIYSIIVNDLRRLRKHSTFRGERLGDILDRDWVSNTDAMALDDFYRQALQQGLVYHTQSGRGTLPGGLVEEIRALSQPAIPWDVKLANWLDTRFQPLERGRTYARPSRRQASTPDIPRPSWVARYPSDSRTFGVVMDTSTSMWWKRDGLERSDLLGKALGAIASYAESRDVPAARLVFCDAHPYDQGYVRPDDIAGRVKVKGQGGTTLQPGIDLLCEAENFPKEAPILVITDGMCDVLSIKRSHAYLMPRGRHLPYYPIGPVLLVE